MPIKTSRTHENGTVTIDPQKCVVCGACVSVCKDNSLQIQDGKVQMNPRPIFGCFACGQCAAVCPQGAIQVRGRMLSAADLFPIPPLESRANYSQIQALMLSRRSVRDFSDKSVEQEKIDQILAAVSTAPMGVPPSEVAVLVLKGQKRVREFSFDFIACAKRFRKIFSLRALALMRPFIGRAKYEAFTTFIIPLMNFLAERGDKGENGLLYDAPLAMYFYVSAYAGAEDATIAATYATLAAESLGLGSCMIGSISPMFKQGGKKLRQKYGIPDKSADGIMVIFGYPKFKYRQAIKRSLRAVSYI